MSPWRSMMLILIESRRQWAPNNQRMTWRDSIFNKNHTLERTTISKGFCIQYATAFVRAGSYWIPSMITRLLHEWRPRSAAAIWLHSTILNSTPNNTANCFYNVCYRPCHIQSPIKTENKKRENYLRQRRWMSSRRDSRFISVSSITDISTSCTSVRSTGCWSLPRNLASL